MPDSLQLQDLVRRSGRGDKTAFAALYDRTAAKLFGVALRIIVRRDVAEEVLQESFVAIWEAAADYDPARGSVMGWLSCIVRHCAIDQMRRQGVRPEGRSVSDDLLSGMASGDRADSGLERRALRRCLDELEEQPRRAVLLAYLYGLTRDELALQLAVPVGTVKSWLRRSLDRLRRCLDP